MKKIIINEEQSGLIQKYENNVSDIPAFMRNEIENGKTPFSKSPSFNDSAIERLVAKGFEKTVNEFEDNILEKEDARVASALSNLIAKVQKIEEPIKNELETICMNGVNEYFKTPSDGVKISAKLVSSVNSDITFRVEPSGYSSTDFDSVSDIDALDTEIEKRKIINAVVVGAADSIAEKILKETLKDIFSLNETLPHLYSKIMKINDYLIFKTKVEITDDNHSQGGFVKTTIGENGPVRIESEAIIFPMLVYETVKGCLELFVSNGLPEDRKTAKSVIENADALKYDPWNIRVGGELWREMCPDCEDATLPTFFMCLSMIPAEDFLKKMKEVSFGTNSGKKFINDLAKEAITIDNRSDFEYSLKQKQEKSIITDDYFSDDEIKNWN